MILKLAFLFILGVLARHCVAITSRHLNLTKARHVNAVRYDRIQKHLGKINKPPVLVIESSDGDVIDCIRRRKQPAFDHPLLKNTKIKRVPSRWPKAQRKIEDGKDLWQTWHRNGTQCPRGTIPVRRSFTRDIMRAKSLHHFGRKKTAGLSIDKQREIPPDIISGNGHEHAIAYVEGEAYGGKATMNVWNPTIDEVNEFSLSQMWVLSGSFDGSDLNSIEAGWQVNPELYGDSNPRLFTYWTSDSYQATGCYNLLCSGFIQTNKDIAIGASISPFSSYSGDQYDITILIWKDPKLGDWWLGFGEKALIGYWPSELFSKLADHATMVEWGGEVVNSRSNGEHTKTQMGSGRFAGDGFGKASYFRNLEIVDADNSLVVAWGVSTLADNTNCYDISSAYNKEWGSYFFFGGPGSNAKCT